MRYRSYILLAGALYWLGARVRRRHYQYRLWRYGARIFVVFFVALQFSTLMVLLMPPHEASAASLTIASGTSETQQSTTNTTFTASDTSIASGSLPAGTYFVAWGAAVSNNNANNTSSARLVRGSTEIASLTAEATAAAAANNGMARSGYWLGALSGSEALTIEYDGSAGTTFIDSKFIKAVRLDNQLVADTDYFTSGSQESSSDEITNAGTVSFTDVKTLTKTFGSASEDYLVFASMEISPDSTANDCSGRIEVDGTAGMTSTIEGEDTTDQHGYSLAKKYTIASGSKSIKLQGESVGGATCDFRRSRIYVFRASIFDQAVENYSSGESTLASATWTDKNSQSYTPNQSETVIIIGSRLQATDNISCPIATRYDDGTTQYVDTHTFVPNNTTDYAIGMSAASLTVSSAKTFKTQYQRVTGSCNVKIKESTLIIWSMTLKPAALKQSAYRWFDNNVTTTSPWWDSSWSSRRKITLDNSASSSNLPNFPIRVSVVGSGGSQNIDYTKTQDAGQDIRFVDSDGTTVLKHEIEKWNESGTSEVWVKVPQIDASSTTDYIWMYYGNPTATDGQDAVNVWDGNYKATWHLKEDPTSTCSSTKEFCDSTTNVAHGDANNMVAGTREAAKIGDGLHFDGSNDVITVDTITAVTSTFTLEAWVNPDVMPGLNSFKTVLCTNAGCNNYFFQLEDSQIDCGFISGGSAVHHKTASWGATAGNWYHIACTFNASTDTLKIYSNGTSVYSTTSETGTPTSATALWIGDTGNPGGEVLDGYMDEVRVSSTDRTADWVKASYISENNAMNTFASEEAYANATPLANQDTAYTLTSAGQAFRLRMLLHVSTNFLATGDQSFKLQYAVKSGTCDTAYSGESYGDVATASGNIRYKDNAGVTDGSAMAADSDDPTHSTDTINTQTYEEANNFTSTSRINSGADGKWEFALVDFSAPSNTSYCFRVVTSGDSAIGTPDVVPEITTANTAPGSPSSLAQKKTDDTVVSTSGWTNESSIKLTATVTDADSGDTIKICAEVDPINTAFSSPTNDADGCSTSGVSTGGTATVTISGLSDGVQYHWQIKAKDAAGAYSAWIVYPSSAPLNNDPGDADFGVDTSAPTGGTTYDGTVTDTDKAFSDTSLSALSANWSGFSFNASGLWKYEYSIGTTAGGTDIKGWTNNATTTSVTATSLTLQTSKIYYVNVKAYDNAGNTVTRSSNGQLVAPSVSFSVSPATVTFNNLNATNSYTDTQNTTITTSTNAYGGYVVRAFASDFLRSPTNFTVADFTGGSYASPDSWQSGDTGFGYSSSDTSIQGVNKFQASPCPGGNTWTSPEPGCYAPFSQTAPGDIIADHTSNVTGSPISNESFTITLRATVAGSQQAARYQNSLVYAITPIY